MEKAVIHYAASMKKCSDCAFIEFVGAIPPAHADENDNETNVFYGCRGGRSQIAKCKKA